MSAKTCYLFGAGASAQVLPVVRNIPEHLAKFRNDFIENRNGGEEVVNGVGLTQRDFEEDFLKALDVLIENVPKHASIDTYAKKLRITGQAASYNQLKGVFSIFLSYLQLCNEVDSRYDSFFASVLGTHSTDFVSDIKILSWNYDCQFEKAYNAFSNAGSLRSNQAMLNVNFCGGDRFLQNQKLSIFKLNGTAGFINLSYRDYDPIHDELILKSKRDFFVKAINLYGYSKMRNTGIGSSLSFAWDNENDEFYEKVVSSISGSRILVIIGYSIPFFNRRIDRKLLHSISDSVKVVYVQDLNPQNVIDNLSSLWPEGKVPPVKVVSSVDQFYVPPQL